jgi:hypothetical protein
MDEIGFFLINLNTIPHHGKAKTALIILQIHKKHLKQKKNVYISIQTLYFRLGQSLAPGIMLRSHNDFVMVTF